MGDEKATLEPDPPHDTQAPATTTAHHTKLFQGQGGLCRHHARRAQLPYTARAL